MRLTSTGNDALNQLRCTILAFGMNRCATYGGSCKTLVDESTWFFESAKSGEFDFVERASPAANEIAFALGKFLFGLTGWKSSSLYFEIQESKQGDNDPNGYEYDY